MAGCLSWSFICEAAARNASKFTLADRPRPWKSCLAVKWPKFREGIKKMSKFRKRNRSEEAFYTGGGFQQVPEFYQRKCDVCGATFWVYSIVSYDTAAFDYIDKLTGRDEGWTLVCGTCHETHFVGKGFVWVSDDGRFCYRD
jgi:hypothetical protein